MSSCNESVFHHITVRSNLIPSPPTYNSKYDYLNWESYSNITYYTRILPPVPSDCPTPTGTKGSAPDNTRRVTLLTSKCSADRNDGPDRLYGFDLATGKPELPDPKVIVEKFLVRRKFRPDPQGTNLMFGFFAQHFTHQFFKTHNRMGLGFTKGLGHGVSFYADDR